MQRFLPVLMVLKVRRTLRTGGATAQRLRHEISRIGATAQVSIDAGARVWAHVLKFSAAPTFFLKDTNTPKLPQTNIQSLFIIICHSITYTIINSIHRNKFTITGLQSHK